MFDGEAFGAEVVEAVKGFVTRETNTLREEIALLRAELERRLRSRASDDATAIARRLADSRVEISHAGDFDYIVVNDQFADALGDLRAIVACQRLRQPAQAQRHAALLSDLLKAD